MKIKISKPQRAVCKLILSVYRYRSIDRLVCNNIDHVLHILSIQGEVVKTCEVQHWNRTPIITRNIVQQILDLV